MFSKDICPNESELMGLVCSYPTKRHQIYLGSKVTVPQNYYFVLGHNGKVLDCFNEGVFELCPANLPKCCSKLKINKQNKNGDIKKAFKAEAYFVNKSEYEISFETYDKAELGNRASGIFTCGIGVTIKFKINDCQKFMEVLLNEYDYIKQGEAEKILKYLTSEMLVNIIYKYNFALSEILSQNPIIEQNIKTELGHKYSKIGLVLVDICNIRYILPKKYQKKYEEKIKQATKQVEIKEQEKEQTDSQGLLSIREQDDNIEQEIKQYVPFGNITIENEDYKQISTSDAPTKQEEIENEKNQVKEQEFVDLNLDKIYNEQSKDNISGIKCLHCGYINEQTAIYCEICENKLK